MSTADRPASAGRRSSSFLLPLLLVLVVLAGVLAWRLWSWWGGTSGLNPDAESRPVEARGDLAAAEKSNIEIYEQISPSVVHVTNLAQRGSPFSLKVQEVPRGTGSGFVWDNDGHIVTNFHVVEGANAVQVAMADREHSSYTAQQVWYYEAKDIAVITINAPKGKLHPIPLGTSHDLKVGQIAYAIGNPFGLDQTLTNGIVSALGREIESADSHPIRGVIQTSAAINPGNSGGPLLDSAGRLIGMNTAILSPSGTFAGIGFAIPVDEINQIVPQLIRHGKVVGPRLGIQVASDQQAHQQGVNQGVLIVKVMPDSPAAQAGLQGTNRDQLGDVIVAIDGQEINNSKELYAALEKYKVGDTVAVTVLRSDQRLDVKVTLQAVE